MSSLKMQLNRTIVYMASALTVAAGIAAAQPCNTGYKPGTGTCGTLWTTYNPQTGGSELDAHWQLAVPYPSSPSNPATGTAAQRKLIEDPCSAKTEPAWVDAAFSAWTPDDATSNWITPLVEDASGGIYIYKTTYTVPGTGALSVTLTGRIESDNVTYSIYGSAPGVKGCQHLAGNRYNGSIFSGPTVNNSTPAPFSTWSPLSAGPFNVIGGSSASLYVVVRNNGYQGLDKNPTPTGLRIEFDSPTGGNLGQGTGGNLNGTGATSLAVVNSGTNAVDVYLNEGGAFPKSTSYAVGNNPTYVAVADLNGDGLPDLAVANAASGTVSILTNAGKGTFRRQAPHAAGENPSTIAIGDVNGDGVLDLAIANSLGVVSILPGTGGGNFGAPIGISIGDPTESAPSSIAIGDLNGDGIPDLAVADAGTGAVTILLGTGGGAFQPPVSYMTAAISPDTIVEADFNGDGKPDLAISDASSGSVYILLNNGDGTFEPFASYPAGTDPQGLTVLGSAGALSLAVADPVANLVTVLAGNGDGTFQPGQSYKAGENPVSLIPVSSGSTGVTLAVVDNGSSSVLTVNVQ